MPTTPGPWHTTPDRKLSRAGVYAGDGDETIICDVTDEDIGSRVDRDANARLIAAAPDLLAACKSVMEFLSNGTPVHPGALVQAEVFNAIAKATA